MNRSPNLIAFVGAAVAALAVDVLVLGLFLRLDMNPLAARLVGLTGAMVIGWMINRTWTYSEAGPPTPIQFVRYVAAGLTPTGVNFSVFAMLLIMWPQLNPMEALAIGVVSGTAVSFASYARFTLRHDP
jgi:putative flippase GtrA